MRRIKTVPRSDSKLRSHSSLMECKEIAGYPPPPPPPFLRILSGIPCSSLEPITTPIWKEALQD